MLRVERASEESTLMDRNTWRLNCATRVAERLLAFEDAIMPDAHGNNTDQPDLRPGRAIAVVHNEYGPLLLATAGQAIRGEPGHAIAPETPIRLNSLCKTFADLIVAQLRDEEKLDMRTPVVEYLEDKFPRPQDREFDCVTLRDLMMHRSGMASDVNDLGNQKGGDDEQIERAIESMILLSRPGETYRYANSGYIIIQQIIEALEGCSFEEVFQRRIAEPLGMKDTHFTLPQAVRDRLPHPYGYFINGNREAVDPLDFRPGRLYHGVMEGISTLRDMTAFMTGLLNLPHEIFLGEKMNRLKGLMTNTSTIISSKRVKFPLAFSQGRMATGEETLLTIDPNSAVAVFHTANYADVQHPNYGIHKVFELLLGDESWWLFPRSTPIEALDNRKYEGTYRLHSYYMHIVSLGNYLLRWSVKAPDPFRATSIMALIEEPGCFTSDVRSDSTERTEEFMQFEFGPKGEVLGMKFGSDSYKKVPDNIQTTYW